MKMKAFSRTLASFGLFRSRRRNRPHCAGTGGHSTRSIRRLLRRGILILPGCLCSCGRGVRTVLVEAGITTWSRGMGTKR